MNDQQMMIQLLKKIKGLENRIDELNKLSTPGIVPWTDYSTLSTIVGWSSFTTKTLSYKKFGNLVLVHFYLAGTSNSANTTFTLPDSSQPGSTNLSLIYAKDAGGTPVAGYKLMSATDVVTCYSTMAGAGWTASGTKAIGGEFWFEAA